MTARDGRSRYPLHTQPFSSPPTVTPAKAGVHGGSIAFVLCVCTHGFRPEFIPVSGPE